MGKRMINYSVYMLPNQMNKEEAPKAYAKAQVKEVMTFRQFVAHIAEHGGVRRVFRVHAVSYRAGASF